MSQIVFENNVIYEVDENGTKQGPFCSGCWDNNKKKIRLHTTNKGAYECPVCGNVTQPINNLKAKVKTAKVSNINNKELVSSIKFALLFSIPTSLLISLSVSADLVLKKIISQTAYLPYFILILLGSMIVLSIPTSIALYKEYKHKGWIIGLALCCFVPFGTILYLISLIWSVILLFQSKQQIKGTK